jgi:hypothetical protein
MRIQPPNPLNKASITKKEKMKKINTMAYKKHLIESDSLESYN